VALGARHAGILYGWAGCSLRTFKEGGCLELQVRHNDMPKGR
jgi:hypothetical protein